jgi:membrane protease YdiL (CAAX protease family)
LQLWAGGFLFRFRQRQQLCDTSASPANAAVAAALLAPLHEEFFYRAALPAVFLNRVPSSLRAFSILAPALLFAAAHVHASGPPLLLFLNHFAFGCCAAARSLVADSTWHAVWIHFVNNAAVVCGAGAGTAALSSASLVPATAAYATCACADLMILSKCWRVTQT